MAMNLASKYSNKVVERFVKESLTSKGLNEDYDWAGVESVTVYSVDTAPLNNYNRTAAGNRYGTPTNLGNSKQDMKLMQDKSFTFVIDKGDLEESMQVMEAGKALSRELKEVVTPAIDTYRLSVWGATTNTTGTAVAITKANAYEKFLDAQEKLDDNEVPSEGRICYCTNAYYKMLKLDDNFIKASDIAMEKRINGQIGEVDGVAIVKVPSKRMPANTAFILIKPSCSCAPMKLQDYRILDKAQGYSGYVVEGRFIYDCFVLESQKNAICKHLTAAV